MRDSRLTSKNQVDDRHFTTLTALHVVHILRAKTGLCLVGEGAVLDGADLVMGEVQRVERLVELEAVLSYGMNSRTCGCFGI